jgi:peptidoglycan/LPS O-acetylase OafA/YrhL
MERQNNFDLIRLFAALSVLSIHAATNLDAKDAWVDMLHLLPGVPIFFFLSGFLIFPSLIRSSSLGAYARKRALRIYPGLYACFAVNLVVIFALGALKLGVVFDPKFWAWSIGQLTVVQFYNLPQLRSYGDGVFNGALWTISVELQFYMLTPIIAYLVRSRKWSLPMLIGVFIIPNICFILTSSSSFPSRLFMVTAAPWLYMFMAGAWLSMRPDIVKMLVDAPWSIILVVFFGVQGVAWLVHLPDGNNITPISFLAIVPLILKFAYFDNKLSKSILSDNDLSYGIYIYHMPVINIAIFLGCKGASWIPVIVIVSAFLAAISWFAVERPALRLKDRAVKSSVRADIYSSL